jgi:hypothetical protein
MANRTSLTIIQLNENYAYVMENRTGDFEFESHVTDRTEDWQTNQPVVRAAEWCQMSETVMIPRRQSCSSR